MSQKQFTRLRNGLLVDALKVVDDVRLAPNTQFNEVRTAEKTQLIELKSTYGLSTALRDRVTTTGTAAVTNTVGDGEYKLETTAGSSSALLESAERGRYIPGNDAEVGIGMRIPTAPDGDRVAEWGYFDENDGFKFGQDSTGVYIEVVRDGVSVEKTYQSDWNGDVLDGNGGTLNPSGITLDTARGNIFQVTFAWYGYGTAEFEVVLPDAITKEQRVVVVHRYAPDGSTSIKNPNLPIAAKVTSGAGDTATFNAFVGGRQFSVVGTFNPSFRITSQTVTGKSVPTTGWTPIMTFRRKAAYDGVSVKVSGLDVLTDNNLKYQVRLNGSLTGPSYGAVSDIAATETALELDTTASAITGGTAIAKGIVRGGGGVNAGVRDVDLPNIDVPNSDEVTLVAQAISVTATVSATLSMREQW